MTALLIQHRAGMRRPVAGMLACGPSAAAVAAVLFPKRRRPRESGGLSSPVFFSLEGDEGRADGWLVGVSVGGKAGTGRLLGGANCHCTLLFRSGPSVSLASFFQIPVTSYPRGTGPQILREHPRVSCTWQAAPRIAGGSGRRFCRSPLWLMHVEGPRSGPSGRCWSSEC